MDASSTDHRLRQRDYMLRIARAMSAQLDPHEVLALVIRAAVTMTGGSAGAIAIRREALAAELRSVDEPAAMPDSEVEIVASYQLEPAMIAFVHATSGRPTVTPVESDSARDPTEDDAPQWQPAEDVVDDSEPGGIIDLDPEPEPSVSWPEGETPTASGRGDAPITIDAITPPRAARPAPLARVRPVTPREPRQMLTLPLRFSGVEIGRIVVFRSEGATLFTPVDTQLLRTFADQAAVAIGNALLHERLARSEQRLAGVVEHSPVGILLLDDKGRVRSANAAVEALTGRDRAALLGRRLEEAVPLIDEEGLVVPAPIPVRSAEHDDDAATSPSRTRSARGAVRVGAGASTAATSRVSGRDALRWVQISVTPLDDDDDMGGGAVAVVTDLTAWRDAERAKTAFLAGLSHELKTPLALIRGFAETLGTPELREPERGGFHEEAVQVILDETAHLTRMVDQLLLAARASAGALRLDLHEVDLGALAAERVSHFRAAFPEHAWRIDAETGSTLLADPTRLREVLSNLLSNAAKYAPAGSTVWVTVGPLRGRTGGVWLRVRDEGVGLSPSQSERVFERFWRADERIEGAGLGLFMTRAIVEAHGGTIAIQETAPGRGTTFRVTLPAAPPAGRASLHPGLSADRGDSQPEATTPSGARSRRGSATVAAAPSPLSSEHTPDTEELP